MSNKEALISSFDPNGVGIANRLFGLPFTVHEAEVVVIRVPWEVTVSYKAGTAKGPEHILQASSQLDLTQQDIPDAWHYGIATLPSDNHWINVNQELRARTARYIKQLEEGEPGWSSEPSLLQEVNEQGYQLNEWVRRQSLTLLDQGKTPVVLGGDHSTPLGLMQALGEKHGSFGILQIDAHFDLRAAYEGFTYSHASIMHHALKIEAVKRLVSVGIRDFCEEEEARVTDSDARIVAFYDSIIKERLFEGVSWQMIARIIVDQLPQQVYISFDIDGLDPAYCPNTGTPVPGGISYDQALYLVKLLVKSGRTIIGLDLSEVGYSELTDWDANVGARVLYRLINLMGVSQEKLSFQH